MNVFELLSMHMANLKRGTNVAFNLNPHMRRSKRIDAIFVQSNIQIELSGISSRPR